MGEVGGRLKKQACCHTEGVLQNIKPRCLGDFFPRKSEERVKLCRALWSWYFVLLYCSPRKRHRVCLASSWNIFNSRQEAIKLGNGEESIWGENDYKVIGL